MQHAIPLESYLYKYALQQPFAHRIDKALVLPHTIILHKYNNIDSWARYFSRNQRAKKLPVLMENPSSERKYALVQLLRHKFREDLCAYTLRHLRLGLNAVQSVEGYLNLYGIEEDDFRFDAAYKIWQRSRQHRAWKEESAQRYHPNIQKT